MSERRRHLPMEELVAVRRSERMARIDSMTPEMREVVNDYGLCLVDSFTDIGVTKPRHIRHLVETVLSEMSPLVGSRSSQGPRTVPPVIRKGWRLVPEEATEEMVDAALDALAEWRSGLTPDERILYSRVVGDRLRTYMDKREKHRLRYRKMLGAAPKP